MSNLIESYEHQYSGLTADITSQISRIPNLTTGRHDDDTISLSPQCHYEYAIPLRGVDLPVVSIISD